MDSANVGARFAVNMLRRVVIVGLMLILGVGPLQGETLIPFESQWRSWPGSESPSAAPLDWVAPRFPDAAWALASAPFRYGDGEGGTEIRGMRNRFATYYLRKEFRVSSPQTIEALELNIDYDDGFAVWINGVEVLRVNVPERLAFDQFAPENHESGTPETFLLEKATTHLREGRNVIAIQGFNTNLSSSDFMLHPELVSRGPDRVAPIVVRVEPPPGNVGAFDRVTVTFSEPVHGVDASDLALNGQPAIRLRARGNEYEFVFSPPNPGPLTLAWEMDANIEDLATPPNPFDWHSPGEIRRYQLIDLEAPFITQIHPPPAQALAGLSGVDITFSEPVVGVDAHDLLVGGRPAQAVQGVGAGPYRFTFEPRTTGDQPIRWADDHQIQDHAAEPNTVQVYGWDYPVESGTRYHGVILSEIMAANQTGLEDEDRERSDWIELFNSLDRAVNLKGWSLSDDEGLPGKWVFGDFVIQPGEYRIVFASAKDRPGGVDGEPHTNFRLSRAGEFLGLFSPELPRQLVDQLGASYPSQRNDHSYGRQADSALGYFAFPSPGEANEGETVSGILPGPRFSAQRGYYDRPFDLILSSSVEGAEIRYTRDYSEPTRENGEVYRDPIQISRRQVVRAAVFKEGHLPSETVTHSYLYRLSSTRRSLPILSLVTERENLFGRRGIMETRPRNTTKRGRAWERPVSVEYFLPDGETGFQIDCGLRIQGGNYIRQRYNHRSGPPAGKFSFRLYFRGDYGQRALTYPLIPRSPVSEFKQIVLRAGMNDHTNPFIVDELVRRLSADMGQVSSQGTLVNLYVNGAYEGYYNPTERIDEDFLDGWEGGNGDYDIIAQFGEVREGTTVEWNRLKSVLRRDLSVPANYQAATEVLDIDNFIDYLMLNIYVGTRDWPHNNWRAARERVPGARWRFYVWDAEWAFFNVGGTVNRNTLNQELAGDPDIARFYRFLIKSPAFRTRFADRAFLHFYGEGALTEDHVRHRFEELRSEMSRVLRNMSRRIGTTWARQRRGVVLDDLAEKGLFLEDDVPDFTVRPGPVGVAGVQFQSQEGEIYYTLDGSDPYLPPDRPKNQTELVHERLSRRVIVPVDDSLGTAWRTQIEDYDLDQWTNGRGGIGYDNAATYRSHIRTDVADVMKDKNTSIYVRIPFRFRKARFSDVDFMTLKVKFDDGFVAYLNGKIIASENAPSSLSWNASASGDHPDSSAVAFRAFNVSDHLEALHDGQNLLAIHGLNAALTSSDFLLDATLEVGVAQTGLLGPNAFQYADAIRIDKVTRIRARSLNNGVWSAIQDGVFYPADQANQVKFTEIMYHPPVGEEFEFVELTNFGPLPVDLSRHRLGGVSFEFPVGTSIAPGESWVIASGQARGAFQRRYPEVAVVGYFGGRLSNAGEALSLRGPDGQVVSAVRFGDQGAWPLHADGGGHSLELRRSVGDQRYPSQWWHSSQVGGSPGRFEEVVDEHSLIISEVMAANVAAVPSPDGRFLDWVEIENRGERSRSLTGYRLRDLRSGLELVFGMDVVLGPGERRVWWHSPDRTDPGGFPFGLDRSGDAMVLVDEQGNRVDAVEFGPQPQDYSLSRKDDRSWTLGHPTPGDRNRSVPLGDSGSLRINELLANPRSDGVDWVELVNTDSLQPVPTGDLLVQQGFRSEPLVPNGYLGPGSHGVFEAIGWDETLGLNLRFSGEGGVVSLHRRNGEVLDEVNYSAKPEGASSGRLPDASGRFQLFERNPSPGVANVKLPPSTLSIHEIMARNQSQRYGGVEGTPDWIEFVNESDHSIPLAGHEVEIDGEVRWRFPAGSTLGQGEATVLWCDREGVLNRGGRDVYWVKQALSGESGRVILRDPQGRILDEVSYGPQIADRSIGLVDSQWRLLAQPTPGLVDAVGASLGSADSVSFNEWRSRGQGDDWVELYNSSHQPVALNGLVLTDDPSVAGESKPPIASLSYIDAFSWVIFEADGDPERGAHHLSFRLDSAGETLRLFDVDRDLLDEVLVTPPEMTTASMGRFPDGKEDVVAFGEGEQSPGRVNHWALPEVQLSEGVYRPTEDGGALLEIWNRSSEPVDLSNWLLGWSTSWVESARIAPGFVVNPEGVSVLEDRHVTRVGGGGLTSILGERPRWLYLAEVDLQGVPTGRRSDLEWVPSRQGESVGRWVHGGGSSIERLRVPTLGHPGFAGHAVEGDGEGNLNAPPWVGPVVISEIHYRPTGASGEMNSLASVDEFVELLNRSDEPVVLASRAHPERTWRLAGGIDYEFKGDLEMRSGERLILVDFDPDVDARKRAFLQFYSLGDGVRLVGPFSGRLANEGDEITVERLARVPSLHRPEGELEWLVEDRVRYSPRPPWPQREAEAMFSLNRISPSGYGSDPAHWTGRPPTPGQAFEPAQGAQGVSFHEISHGVDGVKLRFPVVADRTYRVEFADAIEGDPWQVLGRVSNESGMAEIMDPAVGRSQRFYRLVVQ